MKKCSVPNCQNKSSLEVILYDVYSHGEVFFERDHTCNFICEKHAAENESMAEGVREPRGGVKYPYTNKHGAQGFTIYRPLDS